MKLQIIQTDITTSIYDKNVEVCKFVTGSRQINKKYAEEIVAKVSNNHLNKIHDVIKTHTKKLNTMKDNLSRWEEEEWTDAEFFECQSSIQTLASILSDLNRSLK